MTEHTLKKTETGHLEENPTIVETSTTEAAEVISCRRKDKITRKDKTKILTKVIIRKLPPTMTEDIFLKQLEPLPDHESYYFVPADWSLGQDSTSRAYINFLNQDDIFLFKDRFDGYVFVDTNGAEYPACVEFAPFQGLLKNKCRRNDLKCNTIETDPHYISFLEKRENEIINKDATKTDLKLEYSFQLKNDKRVTSTPLLQYLANKNQERKDERKRKIEQKRRQRDEERKKKRTQITKSLPPSIKEEEIKESSYNNMNKEKDKNNYEKHGKSVEDKHNKDVRSKRRLEKRERNFVKDSKRIQDQQYKKSDNKKGDDCENSSSNATKANQTITTTPSITSTSSSLSTTSRSKHGDQLGVKFKHEIRTTVKEPMKQQWLNQSNQVESKREPLNRTKTQQQLQEKENRKNDTTIISSANKSLDKISTTASRNDDETDDQESKVEMNANVRQFFMNVVNIQKRESTTTAVKTTPTSTSPSNKKDDNKKTHQQYDKDNETYCRKYEKSATTTTNNENHHYQNNSNKSNSDCGIKDDKLSRRIRNKDRPSIEIYQPGKMRLISTKRNETNRGGGGGGGDGGHQNDTRVYSNNNSNPASDCESIKRDKDDKTIPPSPPPPVVRKKVSRYSERRSNRFKEREQQKSLDDTTKLIKNDDNNDDDINMTLSVAAAETHTVVASLSTEASEQLQQQTQITKDHNISMVMVSESVVE